MSTLDWDLCPPRAANQVGDHPHRFVEFHLLAVNHSVRRAVSALCVTPAMSRAKVMAVRRLT